MKHLALLLCMTLGLATASAAEHDHGHGDSAVRALQLDHGKKWATDAPLRQGMDRIRDAVSASLPAIHAGKLTPAGYAALARKVNAEVAFIVANCKLGREADAMLHLVLADVMAGSEAMAGTNKGLGPREGAIKVVHALDGYATYFDHAGWRELTE